MNPAEPAGNRKGAATMQYNFDKAMERRGTGSIKWDHQDAFGVKDGLLPFWIADSDYATLPEICTALEERARFPVFGYTDDDEKSMAATLQWHKERHGWDVQKKALLPSMGVVTSICFSMLALTQPGDKVLIFTPVYDPFYRIVNNHGRTLVNCPLDHIENRFFINFNKLEAEMKQGVKAVVLCNPHNPVGRVWTQEELQQVADLCAQYDVYLFSDEIHGDITLFGNRYFTAGRLQNIQHKLVVYTAISKTFNTAGLVSSNMLIPNLALKEKVKTKMVDMFIHGPNDMAYPAVYAAYTYGHAWVDQQNQYLSGNAEFVQQYCTQNMPEVRVTSIEGTYLMWLDFNCFGLTSRQLSDIFAQEYKIALGIGSNYGSQGEGYMRLNIACPRSTLQEGMERLGKLYHNRGK